MIRIPGKIPVYIHPFFWVLASLLGYFFSKTIGGMFLWIVIILISVLFHEFGHALTAYFFGQHPKIELIALGGRTIYESKGLKFWKQFLITLNGPLFGVILILCIVGILKTNIFHNPFILTFLIWTKQINIFWTIINLLPILPLDGGQLLRIALEGFFGLKGFKISIFIGMTVSFGISFFFFLKQQFLIGALFFLFAYQSFDAFRKSKYLTKEDRNEEYAEEFKQAENLLKERKKEEAKEIFSLIRNQTKKGMLFVGASQYLAMLYYENNQRHEAYEILLSIQEHLEERLICLLHELAFDEKNYPIVSALSSKCFAQRPTLEVALKNAKAFAYLKDAQSSGGWCATCLQFGKIGKEKLLQDKAFQQICNEADFLKFLK